MFPAGASAQGDLRINAGRDISPATAGYFGLEWEAAPENDTPFLLERSASPSFAEATRIYEGPDLGTFESGLPDGTYYYRLSGGKQEGPVYAVTVKHHSLTRAYLFLGIGAFVFGVLMAILLIGHRKTAAESGAADPLSGGVHG